MPKTIRTPLGEAIVEAIEKVKERNLTMSKIELPLAQAKEIAEQYRYALQPSCERVEIVGSVRREKEIVGDIEILCVPKPNGMLEMTLVQLCMAGALIPQKDGPKLKTFLIPKVEGLVLELYITAKEQWGVMYVIRTGSAIFSKQVVTLKKYGGLLPSCYRVKEGRIWYKKQAMETPQERDVFKLLGIEYIEPKDRKLGFQPRHTPNAGQEHLNG